MSCVSWATQSPHVQEGSKAQAADGALGQGSQRGEPVQRGERVQPGEPFLFVMLVCHSCLSRSCLMRGVAGLLADGYGRGV